MNDVHDTRENYCRMLGHILTFKYCRTMKEGLPCGRILDCWFELIAIEEFIEENYSDNEKKIIFEPPKQKMISLLEILEKRKNNKQE